MPAGFEECLAPGGFAGCGICFNPPTTCTSDAECKAQGTTFICGPVECACMGVNTCQAGCTSDAMCAVGETCGVTNHCQPKACTTASDCPVDFACTASACQRETCTADAECQGYCVEHACYPTPGTCVPIPA